MDVIGRADQTDGKVCSRMSINLCGGLHHGVKGQDALPPNSDRQPATGPRPVTKPSGFRGSACLSSCHVITVSALAKMELMEL